MPELKLTVLDGLADDSETLYTLRNCGDMQPNGLVLVGEAALLEAVGRLLVHRALVSRPGTSAQTRRRSYPAS